MVGSYACYEQQSAYQRDKPERPASDREYASLVRISPEHRLRRGLRHGTQPNIFYEAVRIWLDECECPGSGRSPWVWSELCLSAGPLRLRPEDAGQLHYQCD